MLESRLPRIILLIHSNHLGAVLVTPEHPYSRATRRQGSRHQSQGQLSQQRRAKPSFCKLSLAFKLGFSEFGSGDIRGLWFKAKCRAAARTLLPRRVSSSKARKLKINEDSVEKLPETAHKPEPTEWYSFNSLLNNQTKTKDLVGNLLIFIKTYIFL